MLSVLDCAYIFDDPNTPWEKLESDKYDTQFLIKVVDDEVVIAFKESDSFIDWVNNFHFWKKAYKDADITFVAHSGFLRAWKEVRHYIEDKVKELNPQKILVTGWSYGGAMAVLCMEDMGYCFPDAEKRMVTFGAPRVIGWLNWRKIKDRWKNSIQLRNGSDLVTCVPFFRMGFHHVVRRTCIGNKPNIIGFFNFHFHEICNYVDTLEKIRDGVAEGPEKK